MSLSLSLSFSPLSEFEDYSSIFNNLIYSNHWSIQSTDISKVVHALKAPKLLAPSVNLYRIGIQRWKVFFILRLSFSLLFEYWITKSPIIKSSIFGYYFIREALRERERWRRYFTLLTSTPSYMALFAESFPGSPTQNCIIWMRCTKWQDEADCSGGYYFYFFSKLTWQFVLVRWMNVNCVDSQVHAALGDVKISLGCWFLWIH